MKTFTYERADTPMPRPPRRLASASGRQVHRGRHQPARPDEAADRGRPTHLVDVNRLARRDRADARRRPAHRRAGAKYRSRCRPARAPRLWRADVARCSRAPAGQLRNKATTAGNLLQRTRCPYFYDTNQPCNKRKPGSGCSAIGGFSRSLRSLGTSDACIATIPATWRWRCARSMPRRNRAAERADRAQIPIADFHRLPGDTPHIETALQPGELITAVTLPKPLGGTHIYHKVRDRASYAFALVSVAAS
jgi:xanthine dehydrogenase YagS FAD-binding subunit